MSDLGKSCVPMCWIEAPTYGKDLDSNSNTLPATAQHKTAAGQINAGHWQANEVVSTAGPRFALSKMDSIDSIVKGALVLWISMEYSHGPSPPFSFLSKLANRNAVLEAIFTVPTEASSNPLLGRSKPCMARIPSKLWDHFRPPFTTKWLWIVSVFLWSKNMAALFLKTYTVCNGNNL